MKKLIALVYAGLIVTAPLRAELEKEYSREIVGMDLLTIVYLDDNTIWAFIEDHWVQISFYGHAEWCGCDNVL